MDSEFYLLFGMVLVVAIATWAAMKTLVDEVPEPKRTIEEDIKRSWHDYNMSQKNKVITLNEEASGLNH